MKALNFYKISTVVLLLINVAMITFFLLTKNHRPPKPGNRAGVKKAKEIMKLSDEQDAQFLAFSREHKRLMETTNRRQKEKLGLYFDLVNEDEQDTDRSQLLKEILALEQVKITSTRKHFEEVKDMLDPNQYADFEKFRRDMLHFVLTNENKNGPPPKD